ncbi:MAG: hypothetical protein R3C18_06815 [Planctomycetaceae bacterium]
MALHMVELEGIIESIDPDGNGGAILKMFGIEVLVDATAFNPGPNQPSSVSSPTVKLTAEQLTRADEFPGRTGKDGFEAGTAIVIGNFDTADGKIHVNVPAPPPNQGAIEFEANPSLTVEPGETVLLGPVTKNDASGFHVNGVNVVRLTDDRMEAKSTRNEFGFEIIIETVAEMTLASVEGYYGDDGIFHASLIETDGELADHEPQISFLRGEGRTRGASFELKFRGGIAVEGMPLGTPRAIFRLSRVDMVNGVQQTFLLRNYSEPITAGTPFIRFDIDDTFPLLPTPLDTVPTKILLELTNAPNQAKAEGEIEVR